MNWKNLKDNRCPKCGNKLKSTSIGLKCTDLCKFFITKSKLGLLLDDLDRSNMIKSMDGYGF